MGEAQAAFVRRAGLGRMLVVALLGALSWTLGRHIAAQVTGAPLRIRAAWASGCRKFSVIANSAAANAAARQPWSERLRIHGHS